MQVDSQAYRASSESRSMLRECALKIEPEPGKLSDWHTSYVANHEARIALDLDLVKQHIAPDAEILEFGSIPLLFTVALADSGYNVTGCDLAPERYESTIAAAGIKVVKCNIEIEPLPFKDASFDAVIFNELFEHLRINPIFTLSEVLRVMRPGAKLALSTPNLRSIDGILNFLLKNRAYSCCADIYDEYEKLETLGHMGHVREYTTVEVAEFLSRIGFDLTHLVFRGRPRSGIRRAITRLLPRLRPFVSYVATKCA